MEPTPDELAGVVDGFGGLTRAELRTAVEDLAARSGEPVDAAALEAAIEDALAAYYLVSLEPTEALADPDLDDVEDPLLVPGPAALPTLPAGGEDLPHLLNVEPRPVDREAVARSVEAQLRTDAAAAIAQEDAERAELLLDACYEVEAWGPVALDDAKAGLAELAESARSN